MNKVSINSVLDEKIVNTTKIKVNKQVVEVKTSITTEDFMTIVNTIAEACFDSDGNYHGTYEIIAKKYCVISYLTNIEIGDLTASDIYDLTSQTWFDAVMRVVENTMYWNEIECAVYKTVESKKKTSFDKLCDKISKVIDDFSEQNSTDVLTMLQEITNKIGSVDNQELISAIINKNRE